LNRPCRDDLYLQLDNRDMSKPGKNEKPAHTCYHAYNYVEHQ